MSNKNLRNVIRIIHLTAAATLGMYFYSPIAGDETLKLIIQFVTLPSIALTGLALLVRPQHIRDMLTEKGPFSVPSGMNVFIHILYPIRFPGLRREATAPTSTIL